MTDRYALLGHPVSHSRSPDVQQVFAKQAGKDMSYELIDVESGTLRNFLAKFLAEGGRGGNITLPLKTEAFEIIEHLSERAELAGAVNTFWWQGEQLRGDNTDGQGLVRDIAANCGVPIKNQRVLLLGAGGAARGVLYPLLARGPESLLLANRTMRKAVDMITDMGLETDVGVVEYDELAGEGFDIVINATSASLRGELPPLTPVIFRGDALAYDMVYQGNPTVFMEWARAHGATLVKDGWGMMVEQAAESFYDWHGVRVDTGKLLAG